MGPDHSGASCRLDNVIMCTNLLKTVGFVKLINKYKYNLANLSYFVCEIDKKDPKTWDNGQ